MGMMMGMAAMQGKEEADATPAIPSEDKHATCLNLGHTEVTQNGQET